MQRFRLMWEEASASVAFCFGPPASAQIERLEMFDLSFQNSIVGRENLVLRNDDTTRGSLCTKIRCKQGVSIVPT